MKIISSVFVVSASESSAIIGEHLAAENQNFGLQSLESTQ